MLIDDRFLKRAGELRATMEESVAYVMALPMYIFERAAPLVGEECSPLELRHCVVRSALIGTGYAYREAFRQLEEFPFSLTQGDVEQNLIDLQAAPLPIKDPAAQGLRNLLDAGHNTKY